MLIEGELFALADALGRLGDALEALPLPGVTPYLLSEAITTARAGIDRAIVALAGAGPLPESERRVA